MKVHGTSTRKVGKEGRLGAVWCLLVTCLLLVVKLTVYQMTRHHQPPAAATAQMLLPPNTLHGLPCLARVLVKFRD